MIWVLTVLSLIGVVLNIKQNPKCFLIWMFTNASWTIIDFYKDIPAQASLFFVYFCLAIWGFRSWRRKSSMICLKPREIQ